MKQKIYIFIISLLFVSCEKILDLEYDSNQSKIIIEGNITNKVGAHFVKITKSIPLSETGNYPTIDNAIVSISDNAGNSETLIPQGNGLYKTTSIAGEEGRTYALTVNAENKTYFAQSTMPQNVSFDAIKAEKLIIMGGTEYNLIPKFNDPIAKGNNYRFELYVNNQLIKQHFVQNDDVLSGVENTLRLEIDDNITKLKQGDIVDVKMLCVDKNVALYYTTLALIANSGPGGGTTPANPLNNISNGALGLFSAHTLEEKNVTLQ